MTHERHIDRVTEWSGQIIACAAIVCTVTYMWGNPAGGQTLDDRGKITMQLLETSVGKGRPVFVNVSGIQATHGGPQPMLMITKRNMSGRVLGNYLHRLAPQKSPNRWYSFQDLEVGAYDMHLLRGHALLLKRPFEVIAESVPKEQIFADTLVGYHAAGNSTRNKEPYGMLDGEPEAVSVEPSIVLGDPGPGPFKISRTSNVNFLALPKSSHVTVAFSQHAIVDGPGPDIVIQTVDPSDSAGEMAEIHVRAEESDFVSLGEIYEGGPQYIDLEGMAFSGPVTEIRITGLDNGGRIQGFDVIGVGAFNFEAIYEGQSGQVSFTSDGGNTGSDSGGGNAQSDNQLPDFASGTGPQGGSIGSVD